MTASKIVRQVTNRLYPDAGCSDGNCVFGHSGGMHTNGGCNCMKDDLIIVVRNLRRLAHVAQTLAAFVPGVTP